VLFTIQGSHYSGKYTSDRTTEGDHAMVLGQLGRGRRSSLDDELACLSAEREPREHGHSSPSNIWRANLRRPAHLGQPDLQARCL
jgi:hypothetical protein